MGSGIELRQFLQFSKVLFNYNKTSSVSSDAAVKTHELLLLLLQKEMLQKFHEKI